MSVSTAGRFDELLLEPSFLQDPYPTFALIRDASPTYWSDAYRHWLVTSYDSARTVLMTPEVFSSYGWEAAYFSNLSPALIERTPVLRQHYAIQGLINSDPPRHTRIRRIVNRMFTPASVERLRERVTQVIDEMLASVASEDEMDVVADVSYPLPAIVISEILGVPAAERDRFKAWTLDLVTFFGLQSPSLAVADRAEETIIEHRAFMLELIRARRLEDHDDILSIVVRSEVDGEQLTDDELLAICIHLLAAGHETTTNLISSALFGFLTEPDVRARVTDDPTLIPKLIEETLRWEPPVQRVKRIAIDDFELDGAQIRRGDTVMAMIGAANRDPAQFADPDTLLLDRSNTNAHIGFGHGIHFCIGAALARLEAPLAVEKILRAHPDLELKPEASPRWHEHLTLRGLAELPVAFASS